MLPNIAFEVLALFLCVFGRFVTRILNFKSFFLMRLFVLFLRLSLTHP